ncbi:MAG TPA: DoxX family protein [Bryobacteraceae bacterium]|jgi:putative oxidoreductase|nr:DoxX family protein [Bryobacteraceae bacterium]
MALMSFLTPWEPRLRSIARIMIGFTFSLHGWQKFFGAFGGLGGAHPPLTSMLGIAGIIETIGGAFIIAGLFTRPVAFLLAGEMAIGYFRTHAPRGLWPITNGGELAVFYCFFFLWLSSAGAGPWSLDRVVGDKSV